MTDLAVFTDQGRTPAAIRAWMDHVNEMRRSVLVDGMDFMKIPGTPKPSLLQPGAEKLLLLSGLGFEMERIELSLDINRRPFGVTYRCTVPGRSQCEGYAGYDEKRFTSKTGERQPWNSVIKMAQKRAKVGAISSALALSGLFTQDLEDYEPPSSHGAQGEPATISGEVAPVEVHETATRVPSAQAKRYLLDAFESRGWDPLQAQAKAVELWGDRKSQRIEYDDLSALITQALNEQGPNDDSYCRPVEDVQTSLV